MAQEEHISDLTRTHTASEGRRGAGAKRLRTLLALVVKALGTPVRRAGRDYVERGNIIHYHGRATGLEAENSRLKDELIRAQAKIIELEEAFHSVSPVKR